MIHYYKDEPIDEAAQDPNYNTKCIYVRLDKKLKTYLFLEIDNETGNRVCNAGTYEELEAQYQYARYDKCYAMKVDDVTDPHVPQYGSLTYHLKPMGRSVSEISEQTFLIALGLL